MFACDSRHITDKIFLHTRFQKQCSLRKTSMERFAQEKITSALLSATH